MDRTEYVVYFDGLIIPHDDVIAVNASTLSKQALEIERYEGCKRENVSTTSLREVNSIQEDFKAWCDRKFLEESNGHKDIGYDHSHISSSFTKPLTRYDDLDLSDNDNEFEAADCTAIQEADCCVNETEEYSCKIDPKVFALTDIDYIRIKCRWQFKNVTDFESNPRVIEHMRYLDLFTQCFSLRLLKDVTLNYNTDERPCYTFQNNNECSNSEPSVSRLNTTATLRCIPEKENYKSVRKPNTHFDYRRNESTVDNATEMIFQRSYVNVSNNKKPDKASSKEKAIPEVKHNVQFGKQRLADTNETSNVASSNYSDTSNENNYPLYKGVRRKNSYTRICQNDTLNVKLEGNAGDKLNNSLASKMETPEKKQNCNNFKKVTEQNRHMSTYNFLQKKNNPFESKVTITNENNYPFNENVKLESKMNDNLKNSLASKIETLENKQNCSNFKKEVKEQNDFVKKKSDSLEPIQTVTNKKSYPFYRGLKSKNSYSKLVRNDRLNPKLENSIGDNSPSLKTKLLKFEENFSNFEKEKAEQNRHMNTYNYLKKKNDLLEDSTISLTSLKQIKDMSKANNTAHSSKKIYYLHKPKYACSSLSGPITLSALSDKDNSKTTYSENRLLNKNARKVKQLPVDVERSRKSEIKKAYKNYDTHDNNSTSILDELIKHKRYRNTYTSFVRSEDSESSSESSSTSSFILDSILHNNSNANMDDQPIIIISLKHTDNGVREMTLTSEESKANARIRRYIEGDNLCKPGRYTVTSLKDRRKINFDHQNKKSLRRKDNRQVAWNGNIRSHYNPCLPQAHMEYKMYSNIADHHHSTIENSRRFISSSHYETKHRKFKKNNHCRNCGKRDIIANFGNENLLADSRKSSSQNLYVSCWKRFCVIL